MDEPRLVIKRHVPRRQGDDAAAGDDLPPLELPPDSPFTAEQVDIISHALVDVCADMRAEFTRAIADAGDRLRLEMEGREELAALRGKVDAMLVLLSDAGGPGGPESAKLEASETIRRLKVG